MEENNTTSSVSTEWPGAFGVFKQSRELIRSNLKNILLLTVLTYAASMAASLVVEILFGKRFADTFGQLISYGLSIYFMVALTYAYLATARHKKIDISAAFKVVPALYWRMFFLNIVIVLAIIGGLVLLIVPGIIIALRSSLAHYYLVDKNLSVMEAYKASWYATKGNMGKLWGIAGVCFLMILPVLTIIGVLASIYLLFMYSASGVLLYMYLASKHAAQKQ